MSVIGSKQQGKTQRESLIGRTLRNGEYRLEAVLGQGGMGQVFLATHLPLQKQFAIKQARADHAIPESVMMELDSLLYGTVLSRRTTIEKPPDSDFPLSGGTHTDRFLREALFLARLQHPCIPALYDYFFEDGYWYLVMDYIAGPTLSAYIREHGRLPQLEALNYALQLCDVLDYLHQQTPPVIYRDLKPSNILLAQDGRAMLVDFGIARYYKAGQENDTLEFGSPGYAPPEQYQGGGQTDWRSDLYSLGVILHEMLCDERPSGYGEKLESLHYLHSEISPVLSGLTSIATRTEPLYRFQSARTFFLALERAYKIEERRAYQRSMYKAEDGGDGAVSGDSAKKDEQLQEERDRQEQWDVPAAVQLLPPSALEEVSQDTSQQREQVRMAMQEARRQRQESERQEQRHAPVDDGHVRPQENDQQRGMPLSLPSLSEPMGGTWPPAYPESESLELEDLPPLPMRRRPGRYIVQAVLLVALIALLLLASFHFYNDTARPGQKKSTLGQTLGVQHTPNTSNTPGAAPTATSIAAITETPVERSSWQPLPSLPSPEADNAAIYAQEQGQAYIYVTGGFRGFKSSPHYDASLYRYTIASAHWDTLSSNFPIMMNDAVAVDAQGQLYFTAGYSPTLNTTPSWLYMYQPASGALTKIVPLSAISIGYGAAMLDDQHGHLFITQGFMQAGHPHAQAGTGWYRYDIASGQWHTLAPLPQGLGYVMLALDGQGNIILLGGATDAAQRNPSQQVYRYLSAQNTWNVAQQQAPAIVSGAAGCQDGQGQFVIVGASTSASSATHNQSWRVDLQRMQWSSLAGLPNDGSLLGAAACDGNGHFYLERGANDASTPTSDFLSLIVR